MEPIEKLLKSVYRISFKSSWLKTIESIADISEPLSIAIQDTINGSITDEERLWIEKIETLRRELLKSSESIEMVNYGGGKNDRIQKENDEDEGVIVKNTIGSICKASSKSPFWAFMLFKIIRNFKPEKCIELGTNLGISASYQAAALKLNGSGKLVTLEGDQTLASLAIQHFDLLCLDNIKVVTGRFQDTLEDVIFNNLPIDYAFIDGHHQEKATLAYFDQICKHISKASVLVFDDITWTEGMIRAWKAIENDKRVGLTVNLRKIGICVIDPGVIAKQNYQLMLA